MEDSFVMIFLNCEECNQLIGCRSGDYPPRSCKEHDGKIRG